MNDVRHLSHLLQQTVILCVEITLKKVIDIQVLLEGHFSKSAARALCLPM